MPTETVRSTLQLLSSSVLVEGRLQQGIVTTERGIVTSVVTQEYLPLTAPDPIGEGGVVLDVGDAAVTPAPLDLHFHGAGGVGVPPLGRGERLDAAIEGICASENWSWPNTPIAYDYLAALPATSVGEPRNGADPLVEHVAAAARGARASKRCRGMRLEGTFINPARRGAWPESLLRAPDAVLLEALVDAAHSERRPLRVVDVAPELPGATKLIERARELGLVVAIAHTDATYEEAMRAIDAGATLATHTFNAMRGFHHRDPGVLAAVLSDQRVWCELVCDGQHLAPGAIALARAAAGDRIVAVSDASPFAGAPAGEYEWLGRRLVSDGTRLVDDAGALAGSAKLLTGAGEVLRECGLSRAESLLAMTVRPRAVLEPGRELGLAPGDGVWVSSVPA